MRKKKPYFQQGQKFTPDEKSWIEELQKLLNRQPRSLVIHADWSVLSIQGKRGAAVVIAGKGLVLKYGPNS